MPFRRRLSGAAVRRVGYCGCSLTGPACASAGSDHMSRLRPERNDSFGNPWVITGLTIQVGAAVASLYGFAPLVVPIAFLMAICCLIAGGNWAVRGSPVGILLVVIGIGSPGFMLWYPHHLGHFARYYMAEYRAAVPVILAVDAAHCSHPAELLPPRCELRDVLPRELRTLGQSISVDYQDEKPVVFFRLMPGRNALLVYAPGWSAKPYSALPTGTSATAGARHCQASDDATLAKLPAAQADRQRQRPVSWFLSECEVLVVGIYGLRQEGLREADGAEVDAALSSARGIRKTSDSRADPGRPSGPRPAHA